MAKRAHALPRRLSMGLRCTAATLAIAALFTVAGAEPARHLPLPAALAFWVASVGTGLALAVLAATGLARWSGSRGLPHWPQVGLAGLLGLLLYTPVSLGLEWLWPPPLPPADGGNWLDRLAVLHGPGALAAEFLQAAPLYLLSWAVLNLGTTGVFARASDWAAAAVPPAGPAQPPTPAPAPRPTETAVPAVQPCPAERLEHLDEPASADLKPWPSDAGAARPPSAREALGWPTAIGDEVLCVSADLHYLQVTTVLGRATVLGSLAAVEAHFGASGLRIHRSCWVARRAVRRVAPGASGWRCELHDGQSLPISRRRVAEVRALLGRDFVVEAR